MSFLAKIAVESFDRIVSEKDVDVSVLIDSMSRERVRVSGERGVQTHPCEIDCFAGECEFLDGWMLFVYVVDVSSSCVDR